MKAKVYTLFCLEVCAKRNFVRWNLWLRRWALTTIYASWAASKLVGACVRMRRPIVSINPVGTVLKAGFRTAFVRPDLEARLSTFDA